MDFTTRFNELLGSERGAGQRLSKAVGASAGLINGWKTGEKKPAMDYIILLADYFSVTTDYLLCITNENNRSDKPELTDDEQELLDLFRKLPYKNQQRFIGQLQLMASPMFDAASDNEHDKKATTDIRDKFTDAAAM